jgi:hypothetical protein
LYSKRQYLEAHANLDMDKFLIKRLPLINGTLIREKFKLSYMTSESIKSYAELSYGLDDIFLLFDVAVTVGFKDWKNRQTGFRISINLE